MSPRRLEPLKSRLASGDCSPDVERHPCQPVAIKEAAGFTLIELIIALTLVALMAVGLWGAFRISVRSWMRGTEFIDTNQRTRTILDLVKKQMASIYGLSVPIDSQPGSPIVPLFAGKDMSVQFISLNSLRFQENPGLTMVSYDLIRDKAGRFSMVEREAPYLGLDLALSTTMDDREEQLTPIFEDLESFSFEFFDPGAQDRPARWVKEWNTSETLRLPTALSLTMVARDVRGGLLSRHLVVPIMAKPYDPRVTFVNPFENRPVPRRLNQDESRINR
jgi:general secretion pathway protein J